MDDRTAWALKRRLSYVEEPHVDVPIPPHVAVSLTSTIHAGAIIGKPGFGFVTHHGEHLHIPHTGEVHIDGDVEIFPFAQVCRGTVGATKIGRGTKIDSYVHVAHNVQIGSNCLITAGAIIGGSAVIGDNVYVGIGAVIRNKVTIGDGAVIGMGAVVTKDVPAGETWYGNPARKAIAGTEP